MRFGFFVGLITIFLSASVACAAKKNEPLPLTQANIEKYATAINRAAKNVPLTATVVDKVIAIYKIPLEKKLGYDFDKTFQFFVLHNGDQALYMSGYTRLMSDPLAVIYDDLDESLQKKLISQKTYDYIVLSKKVGSENSDLVSDEKKMKAIEIAEKCQDSSGKCSIRSFLTMLKNEKLVDANLVDKSLSDAEDNEREIGDLNGRDLINLGVFHWILKEDGTKRAGWGEFDKSEIKNDDKFMLDRSIIEPITTLKKMKLEIEHSL